MDLVPLVNGVVAQTSSVSDTMGLQIQSIVDGLQENWGSWLLLSIFAFGLMVFLRSVTKRLSGSFENSLFDNWRLALLGMTGLVLSLASGWTTWDGMRNFTGEPALSFMITFGIQGVMLIVAWLIGESFATGMHARGPSSAVQRVEMIIGSVIGFLIVGGVLYLYIAQKLPFTAEQLAYGTLIFGALALMFLFQSELARPYLQSSRIMVRNAVLWVMFLACMATSVFFSFDSLFSTIFPADERARAAELRAQNQVSGILADIGQTIATEELQETQRLFQTEGWKAYETQLDDLARVAQGSQADIEAYFTDTIEQRRRSINEQENRKATAEAQQASIKTRKVQLTEELSRLRANRPSVATEVVQQVQVVSEVRRRMDEQRAIMLAEEKGVEGTGRIGRGPVWRAARDQLGRIEAELQVAQERLRSPRERLDRTDRRIATVQAELAQLDGALAQLQGEAMTAEQRILAAQKGREADENLLNTDPARILPAFGKAKVAFRQKPTRTNLNILRTQCQNLLGALSSVGATKDRVRAIDCDPNEAAEAATPLFALRDGADLFVNQCAGGDKLEAQTSTDDLFAFARRCLSDSGLSSSTTEVLRSKINLAELNRDDKAHRFVVTWNAFLDGNRLAYLALAIAIAIDSLVFMSGLFGANAVRSPLQDVPSAKPRTAKQLEATIEHALLPNKYFSARAALRAMQPITASDGFTNEVVLSGHDSDEENAVRRVLAAGASIGAVRDADPNYDRGHRFQVRPELLEFLAIVAKREFESDKEHAVEAKERAREGELKDILSVALRPHIGDHSAIVLNNMHPMTDMGDGYTCEVIIADVPEPQRPIVRRALNAGATLNFVRQRSSKTDRHHEFEVHRQLYRSLASIAATHPPENCWADDARRMVQSANRAHMSLDRDRGRGGVREGGELSQHREPLPQNPSHLLPQPHPDPQARGNERRPFNGNGTAGGIGDVDDDGAARDGNDERPFIAPRIAGRDRPRAGDHQDGGAQGSTPFNGYEPGGDGRGSDAADGDLGPNAFHHAIVDHFASELGYQDSNLEDIMEIGRQLDVPLLRNALSKALMQVSNHAQTVNTADRSLKSNIERAYEVAPEDFARTAEQARALHDFSEMLKAVRTLFLLAPGGAYRNLLKDMEDEFQSDMDDGTITPRQEQRFAHLKEHMRDLELADLSNVSGWDQIEQSLWKFESQLSQLANTGSGRAA